MSRQIKIEILGDASDAQRALRSVSDAGGKMGGALHAVSTAVGTAIGGGLLTAGRAVVGFVGDGMASLANLDRIASQTTAAIKSTGGAAKVSQADIANLGDKIEKLTGIESEQVQEGENLLLTFTEVQNRTGKGNDIFTQATGILTDMSVALGTDVKGGAVQLGKALNDPIAGVSALARVGVTFTEQQKAQIKAMVEAGDVAGAQKIILAELNKEFGGSAAAFGESRAGQIAKFKNALGDVGETIAAQILPVAVKLGTFVAERLLPAMQGFADRMGPVFARAGELIGAVRSGMSGEGITSGGLFGKMEALGVLILSISDGFRGLDTAGGFAWAKKLGDVVRTIVDLIRDHFKPILVAIGIALSPGGALIAGLIYAYTHFEGFRDVVNAVASFVAEKVGALIEWWKAIWPQVSEAVGHVMAAIAAIVDAVLAVVGAAWRLFGDDILKVGTAVFREVAAVVELAMGTISGIIRFVLAVINGDWGKAWDALKDVFGGVLRFLVDTLRNTGTLIAGVAGGMFDGIRHAFKAAINWIIEKWNRLEFKVPEVKVAGLTFGGFTLGMPDIPYLAAGGVATGPTLAMIGEGGSPEAVVPLDRAGEFGFGDGGPQTIVFEIDGRAVARATLPHTRDALLRIKAGNGSVGFDS